MFVLDASLQGIDGDELWGENQPNRSRLQVRGQYFMTVSTFAEQVIVAAL